MTSLDDFNRLLGSLLDKDRVNACEEILKSLPNDLHDELLKKRLNTLMTEKAQANKRIRAVLAQPAAVTEDDDLRMAYKEYSDEMRHFSTVRSALTTFLVTVSLAAFSAYFTKDESHPFLVAAALIFALASIAVCLEFSRRTSRAYLSRKRIWKHFTGEMPVRVLDDSRYPTKRQTVKAMAADLTNYFLLIGLGLIVWAFYFQNSLSALLPTH